MNLQTRAKPLQLAGRASFHCPCHVLSGWGGTLETHWFIEAKAFVAHSVLHQSYEWN